MLTWARRFTSLLIILHKCTYKCLTTFLARGGPFSHLISNLYTLLFWLKLPAVYECYYTHNSLVWLYHQAYKMSGTARCMSSHYIPVQTIKKHKTNYWFTSCVRMYVAAGKVKSRCWLGPPHNFIINIWHGLFYIFDEEAIKSGYYFIIGLYVQFVVQLHANFASTTQELSDQYCALLLFLRELWLAGRQTIKLLLPQTPIKLNVTLQMRIFILLSWYKNNTTKRCAL